MPLVSEDSRHARLLGLCAELLESRRLIVVSNRGPVDHVQGPDGRLQVRRGSGTLVTALTPLLRNVEFTWIASAMGEGDRKVWEERGGGRIAADLPGYRVSVRYISTPRRVYHRYYNLFCNPLLWFLHHYLWSSSYTPNIDLAVHDAWDNGYIPVNQAFAAEVAAEAASWDTPPWVLLHDYHLYLVAAEVRRTVPGAVIQHVIHTPWPDASYWQLLPTRMRRSILESLCSADILGFQARRDAYNFLQTCDLQLPQARVDHASSSVEFGGRRTLVRLYPLSIDVEEVRRIATSPRAQDYEQRLRPLCAEKTIVRVDRAEPNKNILRGFRAYELLLERHPELRHRVTFLAFLVPSRTHIRQYQRYLEEVQEQANTINASYGSADWQPIRLFLENNYLQAVAGMRLFDVMLVNPVIDGMNLIAKEGPVVNTRDGVLVLSETAGAYPQLADGALPVSPADVEGTMQAIYQALTMPPEERAQRRAQLVLAVEQEDVVHWISRQLEDLRSIAGP
ncbi:MAG: trehalose-6-phosphate synthase [Chloroflexi bacterium]|nr:trehalose-6-phosphate synthase [Chloroflexota bacterium]